MVRAFCRVHETDRDLKPANVLVLSDCQLRITDFGLAHLIKERPTGEGERDADNDLSLTGCEEQRLKPQSR